MTVSESKGRLTGKTAVVTGAARGVGAAICAALAREGASVVAVDVLREPLKATVASIRSEGHVATACVADISLVEGNRAAVDMAVRQFGGLDCLIANAAIQRFGKLAETPSALWDEVQSVNLKGVFLGCQVAIPEMIRRGGGSLIFTASILGIVGDGDLAAYGAAKGGLRALCRSTAVAYGANGIRCNTLCPGDVRTEIFEDYIRRAPDPAAELGRLTALYPLARIASPNDVAQAALFLASDESAYISGTDLIIDGGLLAKVY
jgi:NAD(P)-dependent dehydrogenase (short-subunit alcohol dehydrogenase family)